MMIADDGIITLNDLPVESSVIIMSGTTVKDADAIYVLMKNYRDNGKDVYVPATFIIEGDYCNILNVEGMVVEI